MALTLRAVLDELDRLSGEGEIDEIGRDEIVDSVARAALLGARGNSGVILSQLIRGAAEELASRPGELVDPVLVGAAMARAADRAYDSVREPAEGTILTVVREMAHRVASELAHMPEPRLAPGRRRRAPGRADRRGARAGARRGAELRAARPGPAAGAARGGRRRRRRLRPHRDLRRRRRRPARRRGAGARPPRARPGHAPAARVLDLPLLHELRGHRRGARRRRPGCDALEAIGDSVLVVGDQRTLKVHVHTDEPERATGALRRRRLRLAPRRRRHARAGRAARGAARRAGTRTAACSPSSPGDGMAELFRSTAPRRCRAGRRSTRRPTSCWPASTTCPPRRSSCCRTRRTWSWPPSAPPSCRRRRSSSCRRAPSRRACPPRSRSTPTAAPRRTARRCSTRSPSCAPAPSPRRRATTPRSGRRASTAATRSASSTSGSSPGASRRRRSRRCSASSAARRSC